MRAGRKEQWLAAVGHASSHAWELIFPAIAVPMARELGLPFEATVTYAFGLYLLYGLGAPLAGWLTDRIGGERVLVLCLIGGGLSGAFVAFAPAGLMLVTALAALGLAASLYHPAGLALLSLIPSERLGRVFAINGMAGNIGVAATPFLAGLIASVFGWRWAYAVICIPALAFGVIVLLLFRGRSTHTSQQSLPGEVEKVQWRPIIFLGAAVMLSGLAHRVHTLVTPALLKERATEAVALAERLSSLGLVDLDNLAATLLTSIAYAFGIFGQWFGGRVADSRRLETSYLSFHLAAALLIFGASFLEQWLLPGVLSLYLFFGIGMQPIENSLVSSLAPRAWRGRAYAMKFVLTFGVGSVGTYVVAWLVPHGGLASCFWFVAAVELFIAAAALGLVVVSGRPPRP